MPVVMYTCEFCDKTADSESEILEHLVECQCVDCTHLMDDGVCPLFKKGEKEFPCSRFSDE